MEYTRDGILDAFFFFFMVIFDQRGKRGDALVFFFFSLERSNDSLVGGSLISFGNEGINTIEVIDLSLIFSISLLLHLQCFSSNNNDCY